jgi:hypothetical protein
MFWFVIMLSMVCASVAFTVTEAGIFRKVRELAEETNPWLGELFSCGYCFGHWMAFFLVIVYQPRLFFSWLWPLDYFLTALFIAWLSAAQWRVMVFAGKIIKIQVLRIHTIQRGGDERISYSEFNSIIKRMI